MKPYPFSKFGIQFGFKPIYENLINQAWGVWVILQQDAQDQLLIVFFLQKSFQSRKVELHCVKFKLPHVVGTWIVYYQLFTIQFKKTHTQELEHNLLSCVGVARYSPGHGAAVFTLWG